MIEVSFVGPTTVAAGQRVWAELSVRNVGDRPVWWQAGGGLPPVHAVLTAADAKRSSDGKWSGLPDELDRALPRGPVELPFVEDRHVGLLTIARNTPSEMKPLHPGEVHPIRVAGDVRLPAGSPESWLVRSTAVFYDEPSHYGGAGSVGPRAAVVAECPVAVTDRPDDDVSGVVESLGTDDRLRAFVDDTQVDAVQNSWHVHLAWWLGAWELTVTPEYSDDQRGQSRYRLRHSGDNVIDARRVWWDQAPADDPDGARFPGAPPDDVG